MTDPVIIVIRSGYTEAQKRATYKWNQKNPDKIREYRARTYIKRREKKDSLKDICELGKLVDAVCHPEFRKKRAYRRKSEE